MLFVILLKKASEHLFFSFLPRFYSFVKSIICAYVVDLFLKSNACGISAVLSLEHAGITSAVIAACFSAAEPFHACSVDHMKSVPHAFLCFFFQTSAAFRIPFVEAVYRNICFIPAVAPASPDNASFYPFFKRIQRYKSSKSFSLYIYRFFWHVSFPFFFTNMKEILKCLNTGSKNIRKKQ